MDSVLSIPVVYLLLLFTQLITAADSPSGGNGKTSDASSTGQTSRLDVPRKYLKWNLTVLLKIVGFFQR